MAKFVFKMQNILAVKEKLESQAKAEYGLEISKLREEEQKKILLEQKKLYYEQQLTECLHDTLDMPRIKQYESGHHKKLQEWYRRESVIRTAKRRPDMLMQAQLSEEEKELAEQYAELE